MVKIDELKFDEKGLIPAVVVDVYSREVLTVAYMNRESLQLSMDEGRTCFWSRSRQELWRKGETSGNVQRIAEIIADCDRDALVVLVEKDGQKGILIGKGGTMLKRIGTMARKDIEKLLGVHVFLTLYVRKEEDWRSKDARISEYGYGGAFRNE